MNNTFNEKKENISKKELLNKRKMNVYLALSFAAIVALAATNMYIGSKYDKSVKEERFRLAQNFIFVSAKATSDVKKEVSKNKVVSYLVDVDLNEDGETDEVFPLVDNVKYVSPSRLDKIEKIKKGSRLVFECNVESHLEYDNKEDKTANFPKHVIDAVAGTSAVGLIDHLIAVDAEKINEPRKESNKTYLGYLDTYKQDDGKWQDRVFDYLYSSNIQGTR